MEIARTRTSALAGKNGVLKDPRPVKRYEKIIENNNGYDFTNELNSFKTPEVGFNFDFLLNMNNLVLNQNTNINNTGSGNGGSSSSSETPYTPSGHGGSGMG